MLKDVKASYKTRLQEKNRKNICDVKLMKKKRMNIMEHIKILEKR